MGYVLTFMEGGSERRREMDSPEIVIGRSPECNMLLSQPGISRKHCRILVRGEEVHIEDLNSKNGTRVNGVYIKSSKLVPGDEILVGEYPINFETDEPIEELGDDDLFDSQIVLSDDKDLQEEAGTIIREVNELNDLIAQYEIEEVKAKPEEKEKGRARSKQIMQVVIEVAKALIAVKSLNEILQEVMDLIFEHIRADRGFLMLENETKVLRPRVVKHRDQRKSDSFEISKTIAYKAYRDRMAILTTDAQIDPRFSAGESIRFLGIKSAMCVPLFHKNKSIGIIYLDSPTSVAVFDQMDLDLLTAMANFAAVGIEQAILQEKIEQESKIRERLERYQSPSIVNRIMEGAHKDESAADFALSVQARDVTVLFTDIVGFTPMSERLEPERIAHLLNEYFSEMTDVIFKYEGTLDKYIGDAIMAIFGAPNKMTDHPYRACCTAVEMIERLNILNAARDDSEKFNIRIGINSGRAVAGDIGSIKRMEYTVLGNTVNIASRLESSACSPNTVVIGQPTYERIKDFFITEPLGPIRLKGISEEMPVYRVIERKSLD